MYSPLDKDDERPAFGRCPQCGGTKSDAPLMTGDGFPPAGVHLHRECRGFWLESRFRKIDPAPLPPDAVCACCHTKGEVWRIRDSRVVGGKSEPLHQACAPRFFAPAGSK